MTGLIRSWARVGGVVASYALTSMAAGASLHIDRDVPDYDFQWATIGAPGNRAYEGGPAHGQVFAGRGRTNYRYRMSALEVSTAQWLEFVETVVPLAPDHVAASIALTPTYWGARETNFGVYELRTNVENAEMLPVFGISWRAAAKYVNWLENGKQASYESILNGVYDASTFTNNPNGTFNDQLHHAPGARFWIPTEDEWIKAVHFDPNAEDDEFPGTGRWWLHSNGTDEQLTPGLPGEGQTGAGIDYWVGFDLRDIPLGSYPDSLTPWGLLDASGGAPEWTEEIFFNSQGPSNRGQDGVPVDEYLLTFLDEVWQRSGHHPSGVGFGGVRVASIIPTPGAAVALLIFGLTGLAPIRGERRT